MLFHYSLLISIGAIAAIEECRSDACVDGDLQCHAADASYMNDHVQPNFDVQLLQRELSHTKNVDVKRPHPLLQETSISTQIPRPNHVVDGNVAKSATEEEPEPDHSITSAGATANAIAAAYKIPLVMHFTGHEHSIMEVSPQFHENLAKLIEDNPLFDFVYWNDDACLDYIRKYFTEELAHTFSTASRGPYSGAYRGDICRTAVISREGGFYMDLDVQLAVPLLELIDFDTTFMNVRNSNALFATIPNNPILQRAADMIVPWYQRYDEGERTRLKWLGPSIFGEALESECGCKLKRNESQSCPQALQWKCRNNQIRLHEEVRIACSDVASAECPKERIEAASHFAAFERGLLTYAYKSLDGEVLGWPRFASCKILGCGGTGHASQNLDDAKIYLDRVLKEHKERLRKQREDLRKQREDARKRHEERL